MLESLRGITPLAMSLLFFAAQGAHTSHVAQDDEDRDCSYARTVHTLDICSVADTKICIT